MPSHCRRTLALLLPAALLAACRTWSAQPIPSPAAPAHTIEGDVRLQLMNGARVVLHDPTFRGDSVVGRIPGDTTRHALPLADVVGLEAQATDNGRTTLLVLGITGAALMLALGAAIANTPPSY
jgi:hypothetical protein